jgi:replicative DNA helicase
MIDSKQIPQDVNLEESLLGGLVIEGKQFHKVSEILSDDCFYLDNHKTVFKAIQRLYKLNKAIDLTSVVSDIKLNEKGIDYKEILHIVITLSNKAIYSSRFEEYAETLIGYAVKRRMLTICQTALSQCYDDFVSPNQVISDLQKGIEKSVGYDNTIEIDAKSRMEKTFKMFKDGLVNDGVTGITTGINSIDKFTGGFQKGDLIVIGARPGNGKTALALSVAHKAAQNGVIPYFFQQEMSIEQTGMRELAMYSGVNMSQIRSGAVSNTEINNVHAAYEKVSAMTILIDHTAPINLTMIRSRVKRSTPDLVIVDYLQLMNMESSGKNDLDESKIAQTTRGLKLLAKEMNVPVIILSQLNRQVESRENKKPAMSDLKGSGAIEADADMIILLFNPSKYAKDPVNEKGDSLNGQIQLNFVKNRMGDTGEIWLKWDAGINLFSELNEIKEEFKSLPNGLAEWEQNM